MENQISVFGGQRLRREHLSDASRRLRLFIEVFERVCPEPFVWDRFGQYGKRGQVRIDHVGEDSNSDA